MGADCAQYVSTHLPLHIIDELLKSSTDCRDQKHILSPLDDILTQSFDDVNKKFIQKAKSEVGQYSSSYMSTIILI